MKMKHKILILTLIAPTLLIAAQNKQILPDGTNLPGIDGSVFADTNNNWFFQTQSEIINRDIKLHPNSKIQILPCRILEKMTADPNTKKIHKFRVWGNFTRYKNLNYIFIDYALPIIEKPKQAPQPPETNGKPEPQKDPNKAEPTINEPNDDLQMPADILAKLRSRKTISPFQLSLTEKKQTPKKETKTQTKPSPLVDNEALLSSRNGFIVNDTPDKCRLVLDALGRNAATVSLKLLPCQTLENALNARDKNLEKTRFKASGIVTRYKGENYLLLQSASRVFSYQNFRSR
jgi:hypothetical protein